MDDPVSNTADFPARASSVFRALRMGRHLCRDDGEDFFDLQRHEDRYAALFAALGYKLVHHGQGFFYFTSDSPLQSQRMRSVTLFLLILFQDLEDKKFSQPDRSWERSLLERRFVVNELPHFATAQRRTMMDAVGVTRANVEARLLRSLNHLGMTEPAGAGSFRFRPPVYRFVDLFIRYADDDQWVNMKAPTNAEMDSMIAAPIGNEVSQADEEAIAGEEESGA